MADIDIERDGRGVSLWVAIALLALAISIGWLLISNPTGEANVAELDSIDNPASAASQDEAGTVERSFASEVNSFLTWNEDHRAADTMGVDHRYTAEGIRHLASALGALAAAGEGARVESEMTALRNYADTLEQDRASTTHARQARAAFVSLGGLMSAMQQSRFPDLAPTMADVRGAAAAVDVTRPLLEQRTTVKEFFDRAAAAVRRMSDATT